MCYLSRLSGLLIYVVCSCQDVQKSIDFSERISGRTIFKCVEEPALMGACEQRKTESSVQSALNNTHQMWKSASDIGYDTLWRYYLLQKCKCQQDELS